MALNDNALITVDEYRLHKGVGEDDDNFEEERYEAWINQASQYFEDACHRKFITPSGDISEVFHGNGTKDYRVENGRITATPTVYLWNGGTKAFEDVETTFSFTFTYTGDTGRVYFTDGNRFSKGEDNYQIDYKYGWTQASLPDDLKMACIFLVNYYERMVKNLGITSHSFADDSTSFDLKDIPELVKSTVRRYEVVSYG